MIELAALVREYPDAVFVRRTQATSFGDRQAFRQAGYAMAHDLLTTDSEARDERTFVLKPNVVHARVRDDETGELAGGDQGIVTHPDFVDGIRRHFDAHRRNGYPRWEVNGTRYEAYAQRTCDAVMGINGFFNIVEGVIGRDGTAFRQGEDHLTNLSVAGVNPVIVDAITAYLRVLVFLGLRRWGRCEGYRPR